MGVTFLTIPKVILMLRSMRSLISRALSVLSGTWTEIIIILIFVSDIFYHLPIIHLSGSLDIYFSIYLCLYLNLCVSIYLHHLSISIYISLYQSIYQSVYLSIYNFYCTYFIQTFGQCESSGHVIINEIPLMQGVIREKGIEHIDIFLLKSMLSLDTVDLKNITHSEIASPSLMSYEGQRIH